MRSCYYCFLSFILISLLLTSAVVGQTVVINEVVSANVWGLTDENNENEDWIELYNIGSTSVNLSGYGLTDDPTDPYRWTFPSVTISAGGYKIVFASGKDRTSPNLHTNFKIKSSGETLVLTSSSGVTLDEVETGYIPSDISRGRQPNGTGDVYYFATPTPGSSNNSTGYAEMAEPPTFSQPAGFYPSSFSLTMTAPSASATIRYTLDGSPPTSSSTQYTSPINVNGTTVVRARAFDSGYLFSDITTASYIDYDNHDLGVVSLTSDPDNFFSYSIGIYINYNQDWERPVHVELFEPDGTLGFSDDGGVKTVGGHTLSMNAQKSLAIFARDKYNNERFEYEIFDNLPFDEYKSFVLRNSGNDWSKTMMRDALMQGLVDDTDIDLQAYRPTIVFINGDYYGIHNLREKENEEYLASHHDVDPDSVDMLEMNCEVIEGSAAHYNAMIDYLETHSLSTQANYEYIQTQMEVDQFMVYEAAQIYFANTDWPGNNIKFWRPQTDDGRWRWLLYDTDAGFGLWDSYTHNTLSFATSPNSWGMFNPPWSTFLLRSLLENDDFTNDFINSFADLMNFEFQPDLLETTIDEMAAVIEPEIPAHLARWNQGTISTWYNDLNVVYEFADHRESYMEGDIIDYFNLPGTSNITLNVSPSNAGYIKINTRLIEDFPWTGTYYRSVPIPLTAMAQEGYVFSSWTGAALPDTQSVSVTPTTSSLTITAIFETDSIRTDSVVISEINYNSASTFDVEDWLEIYNNNDTSVDVSGWEFKDSNDDNSFFIPANTVLEPRGFLVLCVDTAAFSAFFPDVDNIVGNIDFNLSNGGELVRLYDTQGNIIDSLTYDDEDPWPIEPDGQGPTLEVIDPSSSNAVASNWQVSAAEHGTPGAENNWSSTMVVDLTYQSGSPVPSGGGNVYFDVYAENIGTSTLNFDVWLDVEYEGGDPTTVVSRYLTNYQPGWAINRPNTYFPVPGSYAAGNYMLYGRAGNHPDEIWDEDGFAFVKSGTFDGSEFIPFVPDGVPNPFDIISSVEGPQPLPTEYEVLGVYPNPFNPVSHISYALPEAAKVSLQVYDISGRQVTTLVDGHRNAGVHDVTFDATGLASGVYFYHLKADEFSAVGKMLLVK